MAWTQAGQYSYTRVLNLVYGSPVGFDPFGGFTFGQHNPNGARIGFEQQIVDHVYNNAPRDNGNPAWFTCTYCNWEYPRNRCQIDHVIPWADYSLQMTTSASLAAARAVEVWVGCNDPQNLVVACDSCNASKNNRPASQAWINNRRQLANQQQGF